MRLRVDGALVGVEAELAPAGRQGDALDPLDELLALQAVADQLRDRTHLEPVPVAELLQLGAAHGLAVFGAEPLADYRGRLEAGEARQIDAALGLTGPDQHPAVAGAEGIHVSGTAQV